MNTTSCYAARLRQELNIRALAWAQQHALAHECTIGESPAVLFRDVDGAHGNFYPASYRCIRRRPEWLRRLAKVHTTARRSLVSHDPDRRELDSAVSSDALLMNIFCHPQSFAVGSRLRGLLATEAPEKLQFGSKPRIPLIADHIERTEIDLSIGRLLVEAKLTERDFQCAPLSQVERYRDFFHIFDEESLPRRGGAYLHYQLIRGALAACTEPETRYCVICDARRPDLINAWFTIVSAVKVASLRCRLQLTTWQELAETLPPSVQEWLADKYGIEASGNG